MTDPLTPLREALGGLSPNLVSLLLLAVVVVGVLAAYAVLGFIAGLFRRAPAPDGPTLAERAEPLLRARTPWGRFDASFDRLVDGTQLGLTGEAAAGLILLIGASTAALVAVLTLNLAATLAVGLISGLLVYFVLLLLADRKRRKIQEQLPDGCFQLARSLRSGLNLPAALRETGRYVPAPLAPVLERLSVALSLGETTRTAVARVADDVRLTEFDLLAETLATHAESGGNLPALLDRLAASVRDRNQFRGYFRSVTALSRLTAVFLALAGPFGVLLYVLFQPELFREFVTAREGQLIILIAAILEVVGLVWLYFLLRRRDEY